MKRSIILLVLATGCQQSHKEAWQIICDSPKHVPANIAPADRAHALAEYVDKKVTEKEARRQLASIGADNNKTAIVTEMVKEAGLDPKTCAILSDQPVP